MEERSIEDILAELQPQGKDGGVKKLMAELTESPRSVIHGFVSKEQLPAPKSATPKKDGQLLDKILEEMEEQKGTAPPPLIKCSDTTIAGELATTTRDLTKQKTDRAKAWLHQLDPLSSEGMWFKEFARHYASELEAALDYLQ